MKNLIVTVSGFAIGSAGFLLLFNVTILNRTTPEDELAPGIVVLAALLMGVAGALLGYRAEHYLKG